jgi:hypothetical protein
MFISKTQINLFSGTISGLEGDPFGVIAGCEFDSYNGITMTAGEFVVTGCYFTGASGVSANILQNGGKLSVSTCSFSNANSRMCDIGNGSIFSLTGSYLEGAGNTHVYVYLSDAGTIAIVSDNYFSRGSGAGGSAMLYVASGPRVTAIGNRCPIDGSGNFITVVADDWHRIVYNATGAWTNSFPSGGFGIYSPQ